MGRIEKQRATTTIPGKGWLAILIIGKAQRASVLVQVASENSAQLSASSNKVIAIFLEAKLARVQMFIAGECLL
jgi:hypothetical protein